MAGIYIHIPFCRKACTYCNFHFTTSLLRKDEMVEAIVKEAGMRKPLMPQRVNTVYFGGGTPSLLEPGQIAHILTELHKRFDIAADAEISLEANPDDIRPEIAALWKNSGINRISLGIQSFSDEELKWMQRTHQAAASMLSLRCLRGAGFTNISADLIYGLPQGNHDSLKRNLDVLLEEGIPHLSCYALTVEDRTPLKKMIASGKVKTTDENLQASQFLTIMERLNANGYEHYEISNFALPGFRSRHNSSYWEGIPYLGLGPSAHSYDGAGKRSFNVANNGMYLQMLAAGEDPAGHEILSEKDQMNEFVMIHLRRLEGLDLKRFEERFGKKERERIERESEPFLREEWIVINDRIITLTNNGKLMADGIAARLFSTAH